MGPIITLVDSYTGQTVNYEEVVNDINGNPIDDSKVDNVIYRKKNFKFYVRKFDGPLNIRWFGAKIDGITDDTFAINKAFESAFKYGFSIYFPSGKTRITKAIGIETSLGKGIAFPAILGDNSTSVANNIIDREFTGSIILYDGEGTEALKIKNTSSVEANRFYGGVIKDISIIKKGGDKSTDGSVGLSIQGAIEYRLYNVSIVGFDIGFKNYFGWSWDAFGLTSIRNRIGCLLDNNSNACSINGLEGHQNNVGVKIVSGSNIKLSRLTVEGQTHGVVICQENVNLPIDSVLIDSLYSEAMLGSVLSLGVNEEGISSLTAVTNINIININAFVSKIVPVKLDNVNGVIIEGVNYGQLISLISTTDKTFNVKVDGFRNQSNNIHLTQRYAKENNINNVSHYNMISNGFLDFPYNLKDFAGNMLVTEVDTTTYPNEKYLKIKIPANTPLTNLTIQKFIKINKEFIGKELLFSAFCKKDVDTIASFRMYTSAYSGIPNASVPIPNALGNVSFAFICPDTEYLVLTMPVTNNTASNKYIYIKSIALTKSNVGTLNNNSLFDYLSGMSGTVLGTTTGTMVQLIGWESSMYEVIITCYGNFTAFVTKSNGSFTITTSKNGNVSYLIIPRVGM